MAQVTATIIVPLKRQLNFQCILTYELIGERNDSIGMELYKIFSESLILHDNDVSITTRTEIDFAQNYATAENPFTEYDFTLTKDKLYESNGYSLPLYLEKKWARFCSNFA
jgi:hypothetical protein